MSDVVSRVTHVAIGQTGRTFWGPGDMYTFLVTGELSGGAMFTLDRLVGAGGGPSPHRHLYRNGGPDPITDDLTRRMLEAGPRHNVEWTD